MLLLLVLCPRQDFSTRWKTQTLEQRQEAMKHAGRISLSKLLHGSLEGCSVLIPAVRPLRSKAPLQWKSVESTCQVAVPTGPPQTNGAISAALWALSVLLECDVHRAHHFHDGCPRFAYQA